MAGRLSRWLYGWTRRNTNVVFFVGGFLFDAVTITRIDALADLLIQIGYLSGLTLLLVYQHRECRGLWSPGKWTARIWAHNVEALHFLYGGLLSAYVVLYFKSASGLRAILFPIFLAVLMTLNEMQPIRRFGHRLRLGLYGFCVASFMAYFVPILIGRVNDGVFLLSLGVSAGLVWWVAGLLSAREADPRAERIRLALPAASLFLVMAALYFFRVIPPVPLSVQYQDIYHSVRKIDGKYLLQYPKPPVWAFWRDDSDLFEARQGDVVHYFARIYAPARFRHDVRIRWEWFDEAQGSFTTTDLRPLSVVGGRLEGYRGYVTKANYRPGVWRVSVETQDGRTVGNLRFRIETDGSAKEREWAERTM